MSHPSGKNFKESSPDCGSLELGLEGTCTLRYNTPEFHDSDDWSRLEDYSTSDHHDDLMPTLVVIKTGRRG